MKFDLTIDPRTERHVNLVLDRIESELGAADPQAMQERAAKIADFGGEFSVGRRDQLVRSGPVSRRQAAIGAMSRIGDQLARSVGNAAESI